ncbi:PhnA domain-containing protein [Alphaproteobacteria bacterium]|jgi:protein PhnA|nr:PhnA domain-containing protein [Alphaproteobacteria bacterium]
MSLETDLSERSNACCELCSGQVNLGAHEVAPTSDGSLDQVVQLCETCDQQVSDLVPTEADHWRCLTDSMWSQVPAVQVLAWRLLNRIKTESWAAEALDMLYLDEETLAWAEQGQAENDDLDDVKHLDSNGVQLTAGDTVVLIKDLNVKGAGFTAKRGTAVRGISLVSNNAAHIEGRINGQQIVILTEFVKRS